MSLESNIGGYVKNRGVSLSVMSRQTGIPYTALYNSLSHKERGRELRGKELIAVCSFLEINPMDFVDKEGM